MVSLSLRNHLLPPGGGELDKFANDQIGEVVQGCKMTSMHYHSGALLELPDGTTAFVHVSDDITFGVQCIPRAHDHIYLNWFHKRFI